MKKYLILFILLTLIGCSKKTAVKSEPEPDPIPRCQVTPTILDFGRIEAYRGSSTRLFTVKNTGEVSFSGTLAVVDQNTSGSFFIPEANRDYILYPGQSFEVVVQFKTRGLGRINGTVEIGNSACHDVYCWGIGY
jgi:hypothetical protein